jgi:hypothetical protein
MTYIRSCDSHRDCHSLKKIMNRRCEYETQVLCRDISCSTNLTIFDSTLKKKEFTFLKLDLQKLTVAFRKYQMITEIYYCLWYFKEASAKFNVFIYEFTKARLVKSSLSVTFQCWPGFKFQTAAQKGQVLDLYYSCMLSRTYWV